MIIICIFGVFQIKNESFFKLTAKWARLTMVQAKPGEEPKTKIKRNQEKKRMRIYVVHTPGYVNQAVFLFRSGGGMALTYRFAMTSRNLGLWKKLWMKEYVGLVKSKKERNPELLSMLRCFPL